MKIEKMKLGRNKKNVDLKKIKIGKKMKIRRKMNIGRK